MAYHQYKIIHRDLKYLQNQQPIIKKKRSIYPLKDYMKLSRECNADRQFEVGFCLIEGEQDFHIKREIGIKYLEESIANGSVDASIYLSRMLTKVDVVKKQKNS